MMRIGWIGCVLVSALCGCSGNGGTDEPTPEPQPVRKEIKLDFGVADLGRATDTGFEREDKIGLYVVNYDGQQAGSLKASGNHVDNMRFTYSTSWTPDEAIYWKDNETKVDFYGYYPYTVSPGGLTCSFEVKADQSSTGNYKASEFLWGKTAGVSPTANAVSITLNHVFSCARIKVEAGDGFTSADLEAATIGVNINGTRLTASVNLATGVAEALGEAKSITLGKDGEYYKALVVPQAVAETDLVSVSMNGKEYKLKKGHTFVGNKRYTFTVKVSKTSNGVNVNIGQWDDDGVDYGGVAE